VDTTLYCWSCRQTCHAKKECPSKPRHVYNVGNSTRKPVAPAKNSMKGVDNHGPKQLKCSNSGQNNHTLENCFAPHLQKRSFSEQKKNVGGKY
jgi:hypothetical protein